MKISAKLASLGLLEIKIFWDTVYEVIVSVHDITNKILLCDLNYIVDVVLLPTLAFDKSMTESIITSIL